MSNKAEKKISISKLIIVLLIMFVSGAGVLFWGQEMEKKGPDSIDEPMLKPILRPNNAMWGDLDFSSPAITYKVIAHDGNVVAFEIDGKAKFYKVGDELKGYGLIEYISTSLPLKILTERGLVSTL